MNCKQPGWDQGPIRTGGAPYSYVCELDRSHEGDHSWNNTFWSKVTWPMGERVTTEPKPKPVYEPAWSDPKVRRQLGLMQPGSNEYNAGLLSGLVPDFGVTQAVANFYALEEMVRDGFTEAEPVLDRYELVIEHQFTTYVDMAIGGELRHMGNGQSGDDSGEHCSKWKGCCMVGVCFDPDCGCGECQETYCPCVEDQVDDEGSAIECESVHCDCAACTNPDCGCDNEADENCDCGDCSFCGKDYSVDLDDWASPNIVSFIQEAEGSGSSGRSKAWRLWLKHRQSEGPNLVEEAYYAFMADIWASGYGGDSWALCAKVLSDYLQGKIRRRTFIDRCFTLQHNGGCIFNKVYDVESMGTALSYQADGQYDTLVTRWASDEVQQKWAYYKGVLKGTRVGRKHLAERLAYQTEIKVRDAWKRWLTPEELAEFEKGRVA